MGSLNLVGTAAVLTLILTCPACYGVADKHPDCSASDVGTSTIENGKCHWKYHPALHEKDLGLNERGSCISCYGNACHYTKSHRCRSECPKYWALCINYTSPVLTENNVKNNASERKRGNFISSEIYHESGSDNNKPSQNNENGGHTISGGALAAAIIVPLAVIVVIIILVVVIKKRQAIRNNGNRPAIQYHAQAEPNNGGVELVPGR